MGRYFIDPSNDHEYEGHDLVNLRLTSQLTPNVRLHGQVKNLLDEEYADRADFAFGDYRFFPGRDRTYQVGVSYQF
jgi:iron complex outermembrane receptor protein